MSKEMNNQTLINVMLSSPYFVNTYYFYIYIYIYSVEKLTWF